VFNTFKAIFLHTLKLEVVQNHLKIYLKVCS